MKNPVARSSARQRGIVLYVALVVLVAMLLAGVAVLRSVGAGQAISGNVAFKQNVTSAGDRGVVNAMTFLRPASAASAPTMAQLEVDQPSSGYLAAWNTNFNPATFDWECATLSPCPVVNVTNDDGSGNQVSMVIHRLCSLPGALDNPANTCVVVTDGNTLSGAGGGASFSGISPPPLPPYFRVTTRVIGPRNTVSYVQVVMK